MSVPEPWMPDGLQTYAQTVDPDEKAYMMVEMVAKRADSRGHFLYRIVWVNRNDKAAAYVYPPIPLEPGMNTKLNRIYSDWEDSVGYLNDLMDGIRADTYMETRMAEMQSESTMISDTVDLVDEMVRVKNNQTVFGPGKSGANKERTGFHPKP